MPLDVLTRELAVLTTEISLMAIAASGLSWAFASLLKGAPIPIRELKEFGQSLQIDAVKALFLIAIYSSVASLVAWLAVLLASAA